MKWLHLSDLHYDPTEKNGYNRELIRLLPIYLKEKNIKVDEIFITGDFRFAPKAKRTDVTNVLNLITKIAEAVGVTEIEKHVHIVPGNHDLDRSAVRKRVLENIYSEIDKCSPRESYDFSDVYPTLTNDFSFFGRLYNKIYGHAMPKKNCLNHYIELEDVNILFINTAIASGLGKDGNKDLEAHNLICASSEIQKILSTINNDKPVIALGHHNIDFIAQHERMQISRYLSNFGVKLYLCGHNHTLNYNNYEGIHYITTGCLKNGNEIKASFCTGEYSKSNNTFIVNAYDWENNSWSEYKHFHNGSSSIVIDLNKGDDIIKKNNPGSTDTELRQKDYDLDKSKLIRKIKTLGKEEAVNYILSGLSHSTSQPINSLITPDIFYKEFYVPRADGKENVLDSITQKIFQDRQHNMVCLRGSAGTGKTTFIKTLECRTNNDFFKKTRFNYIILDCAAKDVNFTSQKNFPSKDLYQRFKKILKQMIEYEDAFNNAWKNRYIGILKEITKIENCPGYDEDNWLEFIKSVKEVIKVLSLGELSDDSLKYAYSQKATKAMNLSDEILQVLLFVLILTTKDIVVDKEKMKYIIAIDNIEAHTNSVAMAVGDSYKIINDVIKNIYLELSNKNVFSSSKSINFMLDYTFIFCVRPTTNFALCSIQNYPENVFGQNDEYIIERQYYDFTPEALLKKLKFLYTNNIKGELFEEVKKITMLLIPQNIIEKYLREFNYQFNDDDVKLFTAKKYLPFFNNNFRNAIFSLNSLYKRNDNNEEQTWMEQVLSLAQPINTEIKPVSINLSRMIIFKNIYDTFRKSGYFEAFGIKLIDGKAAFSLTRILLSYLYWNKCRCSSSYEGITLSEIINFFEKTYSKEEIISSLCQLSKDISTDPQKEKALQEWGELIEFNKGIECTTNIKKVIKKSNIQNIIVKITPAGQNFVEFTSVQFEFFSSRILGIPLKPLVLYSDNLNEENNIFDFEIVIDKVYDAVYNFSLGIKKGIEKVSTIKSDENSFKIDFQIFIISQELYAVISECINYIDRFRRVLFQKTKNVKANEVLLDKIVKFNGLFDQIEGNNTHRIHSIVCFGERNISKPYFSLDISQEQFEEKVKELVKRFQRDYNNDLINASIYDLIKNDSNK